MKHIKKYTPTKGMIVDPNGEYVKVADMLKVIINSFKAQIKDEQIDDILDRQFAKRKVKTRKKKI